MKRSIALLLLLLYAFTLHGALAEDASVFAYSIVLDTYQGDQSAVVVPSQIDGKTVTAIGDFCFLEHEELMQIELPDTITSIGNGAFSDTSLTEIHLPPALKRIGNGAFDATDIESIVVPDTVETVGEGAFSPSNIQSFVWECRQDIPAYACRECDLLESVTMCEGVYSIGQLAFYGCTSLWKLQLSETLETIGASAFEDCWSPESVELPGQLTEIGELAFWGCKNLVHCIIPPSVVYIAGDAFSACDDLVLVVTKGSYAESYAVQNGLAHRSISP